MLVFLKILALIVGMTKTETIKDSVTAQLIASAISLNNCAISESKNNKGRNTATVVIVEAAIAPHTSRVPSMDAAMGDFPRCKCEKIFSRTTIELSTSIPTAKLIPARDTTLILRPSMNIPRKVPIADIGMAHAMIRVGLIFLRKSIRTIIANKPPSKRF